MPCFHSHGPGPQAGDTGGGSSGSLRCLRILRMGRGSVIKLISRLSPPHAGQSSGNSSPTRVSSFAQAVREVSCERGVPLVVQRIVREAATRIETREAAGAP
jgi:hypothetical protein